MTKLEAIIRIELPGMQYPPLSRSCTLCLNDESVGAGSPAWPHLRAALLAQVAHALDSMVAEPPGAERQPEPAPSPDWQPGGV